jgi:hypothetical protein
MGYLPRQGQVDEHLVGIAAGQPQLVFERGQDLPALGWPSARPGALRVKRFENGELY